MVERLERLTDKRKRELDLKLTVDMTDKELDLLGRFWRDKVYKDLRGSGSTHKPAADGCNTAFEEFMKDGGWSTRDEEVAISKAYGVDGVSVERVQLGVRMEKRMVKVLKGLAEFQGITLGQMLEKIVLHSFEPVEGQEGEMAASPHGRRSLEVIADLKRIYGLDYDMHAARAFREPGPSHEASPV